MTVFHHRQLSDVTKDDLAALVESRRREDRRIEYKARLPELSDERAKKDFVADVAAFANASGGDIIYGMTEEKDSQSGGNTAIPVVARGVPSLNVDATIRRMQQVLDTNVDPPVSGIGYQEVGGLEDGSALVVRVPRSWLAPHRCRLTNRFAVRYDGGNRFLDTAELRAAFRASDDIPHTLRRWRDERLGRIASGEIPFPVLPGSAKIVLHVVPLRSLDRDARVELRLLTDAQKRLVCPMYDKYLPLRERFTVEGIILSRRRSDDICLFYSQVFRSGALEIVNFSSLDEDSRERHVLKTAQIEQTLLVRTLPSCLEFLKESGAEPPISIMLSLVGVEGAIVSEDLSGAADVVGTNPIDRAIATMPDVLLESFAQVPEIDIVMRDAIDGISQSAGKPGSPNYDENGRWQAKPPP